MAKKQTEIENKSQLFEMSVEEVKIGRAHV